MPDQRILIPALLLLVLGLPAMAQQVYRSTDADGNVIFSDTPTPGSETITVDTPNLADPVKLPPPSPMPDSANPPQVKPEPVIEGAPDPEGEIYPDSGRKSKKKRRRRDHVLEQEYEYGR